MADRLGLLLLSGSHERAHYAFMVATCAAALGRTVVLFASNGGCHALLQDWSGLVGGEREEAVIARGVAGLDTLRDAAAELGIAMIACEAGLRIEGLRDAPLLAGVRVAGIATFLSEAGNGQMLSL